MKHLILIIILILFLPSIVLSKPFPKSDWLKAVGKKLPTVLCKMEPFNKEGTKMCLIYTKSFTRACIFYNYENIPDMLNQPKDGTKWGSILGTCVGKLYDSLQGN